MNKEQALREIFAQLDILGYLADSATSLKIGDYIVSQDGKFWTVSDSSGDKVLHTRMAAIGVAKCLQHGNLEQAQKIISLDDEVGELATHTSSIANASKSNEIIKAKLSEAEYKHRAKMQDLADLILNIL